MSALAATSSLYPVDASRGRPEAVRLALRQQAEQLACMLEERALFRLLVVSPRAGCGKTTWMEEILPYLRESIPGRVHAARSYELPFLEPDDYGDRCLLLLEGPSLVEGGGELGLSPKWRQTIEAAIIVARARWTTAAELEASARRLRNLRIRPLGLVWNERDLVTPAGLYAKGRRVARRWIERAPIVRRWS